MDQLPDRKHDQKLQQGPFCVYHGKHRSPTDIKWIIIHDAEGATADGVANYGASDKAEGSWHVVSDDKKAIRCLHDDVIAYQAYSPANGIGLGFEVCGYARWSKYTWFVHQASLKRAAWVVARWCVKYDIPVRILTPAQLMRQDKGITFHVDITRALGVGSHSDPGPYFPRGYFLLLVRKRVKWLKDNAIL